MQVADWLLTPQRAAIHLPTATAVIADLHLGYDQVRQRSGEAVPCGDARASEQRLAALVREHGVRRLVVAGDLLEDGRQSTAVLAFREGLQRIGMDLVGVVPGNHDRHLATVANMLPLHADGVRLGRWHVLHGEASLPRAPVVQGHVHPCVRLPGRLTAPCYLVRPNRIILPAFSLDAAGVAVLRSPAWRTYRCFVIAGCRVLDFGILARSCLHRRC